jgi:O-antigen ligase
MSLVVYMVLFFAVVEFVKKSDIQKFINAVIITASVAAVYSLIQYTNLDPYDWSIDFGYDGRPSSTFGHPTFMGAYMAMTVPLVVYSIMKGKYWLCPIAGLLMYVAFLAKSRSAFLGMLIALVYLFVLYRKAISYKVIGFILVALVVLSVFMPNSPVKRFIAEYKEWNMEGNIGYRVQMANTCLDIAKDNYIVGIGMDNLAYKYSEYYQKRYKKDSDRYNNRAHNAILEVLVTQGIIGLLAWLSLFVFYFLSVWKNRQDLMVITLSSCVVAYMAQNMFTFGGPGITPLFWMLMGMTVVAVKNEEYHYKMFYYPVDDNYGIVYKPTLSS